MFRHFASVLCPNAAAIFKAHPSELKALLEAAWQERDFASAPIPGLPDNRKVFDQAPNFIKTKGAKNIREWLGIAYGGITWDHLIYAYMIENTGIYEIFRRVLHEFLHGEKLGVPDKEVQLWLRNTEELFYRDPPSFYITDITSHIRPDMRATRRNAYWQMFGMDLNHVTDDAKPYPYIKSPVANIEFVKTFEELLREAWVAIINANNTSGESKSDPVKIKNLISNLNNMLKTRRIDGNLSREEFFSVSLMSWFHLTLSDNYPIIEALRARAITPEQRLFKIAQQVGLPAHALSKSYFDIADQISDAVIAIETDKDQYAADLSYKGPTLNPHQEQMGEIITHWSIITGHDVKARKVATTQG